MAKDFPSGGSYPAPGDFAYKPPGPDPYPSNWRKIVPRIPASQSEQPAEPED